MINIPNDTGFSPAVAVTGTPSLLPRLLITPTNEEQIISHDIIKQLAKQMSRIDFNEMTNNKHHATPKSYIPPDLKNCKYVWLRADRVGRPLEAPFKIIKSSKQKITIQITTGQQSVSVDRLKPAILPEESKVHSNAPLFEEMLL